MCEELPLKKTNGFIDLNMEPIPTPVRVVWGESENLSDEELKDLREQVDLAITGPDFSIVLPFPITWEEIKAYQETGELPTICKEENSENLYAPITWKEIP